MKQQLPGHLGVVIPDLRTSATNIVQGHGCFGTFGEQIGPFILGAMNTLMPC